MTDAREVKDIVDRLRDFYTWSRIYWSNAPNPCEDAANEIERLREALLAMMDRFADDEGAWEVPSECWIKAREVVPKMGKNEPNMG